MKGIDVEVSGEDIEACHRLPTKNESNNKKTIVRFINRKKCEKSLKNKKKLANVNLNSLEFPEGTQIFISENLNDFFHKIGWYCRRLKREGLIYSFKYQNESYAVKVKESSRFFKITHPDKLFENFPDFFAEDIEKLENLP